MVTPEPNRGKMPKPSDRELAQFMQRAVAKSNGGSVVGTKRAKTALGRFRMWAIFFVTAGFEAALGWKLGTWFYEWVRSKVR